jgi:hypothetical protein
MRAHLDRGEMVRLGHFGALPRPALPPDNLRALALQKRRRDEGRALLDFMGLSLLLAGWRRDPKSLWLAEAPFGTQQQAFRNLETAYGRQASGLAQHPKFKKRGRSDSFRHSGGSDISLDQANSRIIASGDTRKHWQGLIDR